LSEFFSLKVYLSQNYFEIIFFNVLSFSKAKKKVPKKSAFNARLARHWLPQFQLCNRP